MSKRALVIWRACLAGCLALGFGLVACVCEEPEECEECPEVSTAQPAFTLVLEADSYGSFMPTNNQFPCPEEPHDNDAYPGEEHRCWEHHSGFFVQLSDFFGALHGYHYALLRTPDATGGPCPDDLDTLDPTTEFEINRLGFKWIDVVCDQGFPKPIKTEQAQMLLPQAADGGRLLHRDMDWELTSLVTLWQGEKGLSVSTATESGPEWAHSHESFTFNSDEPCEVRVWKELADDGLIETYPVVAGVPGIAEIRICEATMPTPHGRVHAPPWE